MTDSDGPAHRSSRREARERATELAYEAEIRSMTVDELLAAQVLPVDPFVEELLERAERLRPEVDAMLEAKAKSWPLSRMPALDLVIMRVAAAELIEGDTPTGVVLSQAVELAKRYSTDESGRFVNGVLAAVAEDTRSA